MITDRSSLKMGLEVAGEVEVDPVAPRLDVLAARVMSSIASHDDDDDDNAVVLPFQVRRPTTTARKLSLGVAAASILAVAVLAAGWFTTGGESLVIAAADDVTVVYPDGVIAPGEVGLELPVGADVVIRGSMVVDGVTYGPGDYTITGDGVERVPEVDESSVVANRDDEDAPTSVLARNPPATTIAPASTVDEDVVPLSDFDGPSRAVPSTSTVDLPDDRSTDEDDSNERIDLVPVTRATTTTSEATTTTRPSESTTTAPQDRPTTTTASRDRTDRSGD